jgi:D-methionine transport system permease protein
MVVLLPFTKMLVHTSIGVSAAIVPLTIAATAFTARLIETSLLEVDKELLEAMKSFGLTDTQVIFRVMLSEALPAIVSNIVLAMIAILGSTAVAGAVGAGGIGSVALTYGYQRFDEGVMVVTVITLIAMVQVIQVIGNYVYRKLKA